MVSSFSFIAKFLILFQLSSIVLTNSVTNTLQPRQNNLSSCASDCYTKATSDSNTRGSCSGTDKLCLCRRVEFRQSVKTCWKLCTDIEEAAAKTWFGGECAGLGVADIFSDAATAVGSGVSAATQTYSNARNSQPRSVLISVPLIIFSGLIPLSLGFFFANLA